jgi:hypothetical protein
MITCIYRILVKKVKQIKEIFLIYKRNFEVINTLYLKLNIK